MKDKTPLSFLEKSALFVLGTVIIHVGKKIRRFKYVENVEDYFDKLERVLPDDDTFFDGYENVTEEFLSKIKSKAKEVEQI